MIVNAVSPDHLQSAKKRFQSCDVEVLSRRTCGPSATQKTFFPAEKKEKKSLLMYENSSNSQIRRPRMPFGLVLRFMI